MLPILFSFLISLFAASCSSNESPLALEKEDVNNVAKENDLHETIVGRFSPPLGYKRVSLEKNSFGYYLQHLPLKEKNALVTYYNGNQKANNSVYLGVVDLPIGNKNLHQCADAVIRLRAEYLFAQKKYVDIHFTFLSDGKPRYYESFVNGDHSYATFWKYLEHIFEFANTTSLSNELTTVNSSTDIKIGDVLIEKKIPYGHAVIVVDMAFDNSGKKKVMLAQSYMPAQETQILMNPAEPSSVWYDVKSTFITPEWNFKKEHLRRFYP